MSLNLSLNLSLSRRLRGALARFADVTRGAALPALVCALGALAITAPAQAADRSIVTTERVRAELLAHAPEGVGPGRPLWLGLRITHQPHWHTYWRNPGDSGLPTTLDWRLPAGLATGDIAWPVPRRIPIGHLVNYGYEGTVLLPVPLTVLPDFRPSPLAPQVVVKLKAQWLVCKTECIPEEGEFEAQLPVQGSTALHGAAFQQAWAAQPRPLPGSAADSPAATTTAVASSARVEGQAIELELRGLPVALRGRPLTVFPETPGVIENGAAWTQAWKGGVWTAKLPLSAHREASPGVLPVVVADGAQGWRAELPVAGNWPPAAAAATGVSPALAEALRRNAQGEGGGAEIPVAAWLIALLGALMGGMALNLMPCVFPVLAVKVVGLTRHAADARLRTLGGLAYAAGVVASFLALGALMLALRAGGEQLGWGFQLQSPAVVATLAALFTLIGLNLAGLFEFGRMVPAGWGGLQLRHPLADAALSGVLAVAIASPCTAPFMGASLGMAVALPAWQAMAVFAALGLGMALPYLAVSAWPAMGRWLPRPGPWMEQFRRLMAFPIFATVAWLVWVLGQQSGIDGAGALLVLLVSLAMLAWALGLPGRARQVLGVLAAALLVATLWALGPWVTRAAPVQAANSGWDTGAASAAGTADAAASAEPLWQPWSPARVEQALAQGRPVFVDFTAAWCVTCQYNKATTLADASVLSDLAARNTVLLRADWTRRDPAISAALNALGRSGVPVYLLQAPGRPPQVLSEVLSAAEVRRALATL